MVWIEGGVCSEDCYEGQGTHTLPDDGCTGVCIYVSNSSTNGEWGHDSTTCEAGCICPFILGPSSESSCTDKGGAYLEVGDSKMCTFLCGDTY